MRTLKNYLKSIIIQTISMGSTTVHNYLNTLIFCIIAKIISILLLIGLFFSKTMRTYAIAILTIEIGLLLIIIHSLYSVIAYNNMLKDRLDKANDVTYTVTNCPHYFVREVSSNGKSDQCLNTYKTPDGVYSFEFQRNKQAVENVSMTDMQGKKLSDICANITEYDGHPWTDLKTTCHYMA